MNRRRFIIGMLSLPAAAVAAKVARQIPGAAAAHATRPSRIICITNPTGHESWVRDRYLDTPTIQATAKISRELLEDSAFDIESYLKEAFAARMEKDWLYGTASTS